jgi:hypothetical protein
MPQTLRSTFFTMATHSQVYYKYEKVKVQITQAWAWKIVVSVNILGVPDRPTYALVIRREGYTVTCSRYLMLNHCNVTKIILSLMLTLRLGWNARVESVQLWTMGFSLTEAILAIITKGVLFVKAIFILCWNSMNFQCYIATQMGSICVAILA